jgi:hypothetical protein
VLLRFFDNVNLLGALAKVGGAAAVAREALLRVIELDNCELTTFMLLKGV